MRMLPSPALGGRSSERWKVPDASVRTEPISLGCHLAGRGVPSITEGELRPSPAPSHCPQACPVLPPLLLLGPVLRGVGGGGARPRSLLCSRHLPLLGPVCGSQKV